MTLRLHLKVYQHKLSYLWVQDHFWKFRSSAPLMTREDSNFYNTGSWDFSRNNTSRRYERDFWIQNPRYKKGTLFSLWKALLKMCLGSVATPRATQGVPKNTLTWKKNKNKNKKIYKIFYICSVFGTPSIKKLGTPLNKKKIKNK